MSLKDKFDTQKEIPASNADDTFTPETEKDIKFYDTPGNARNVCFIEASGKMTF